MKLKVITIILGSLIFVSFLGCAKNKLIPESELPVNAKNFITAHVNDLKIVQVEKDTEILDKEYTVLFSSGLTIEFDNKGNWKKTDGHSQPIPSTLIPSKIMTYITSTYPEYYVKKIEIDFKKYEVKLSNGFELIFDKAENFIKID